MAIQSQPSRISEPFAGSGTKNTIPATNATPSASQAASWASGFPPECSQPISAGGCPVPRNDVNGVLNWLSQGFAFNQDGGIWEWSALADYDLQRVVRGSDGLLYWSVQQSGPGVAAGAQDPTADDGTYWRAPYAKTMGVLDSSPAVANTNWVHLAMDLAPMYVDGTNGNDSNDGLTQATAVKTITQALLLAEKRTGQTKNIFIAAGSYTEDVVLNGRSVYFVMQGNVSISGTVKAAFCSELFFTDEENGYTLTVSNTGTIPVSIEYSSSASFSCNLAIDATDCVSAIRCTESSCVEITGALAITCSNVSSYGIYATNTSSITVNGAVTIGGTSAAGGVFCANTSSVRFRDGLVESDIFTGGNGLHCEYTSYLGVIGSQIVLHSSSGRDAVWCVASSSLYLYNFTTLTISSSGVPLNCENSSLLKIQGVSKNSSTLTINASNSTAAIDAIDTGCIIIRTVTINISGNVTSAVVNATGNSFIRASNNVAASGTVTGKRYAASVQSTILTGGGGANFFPGTVAGTASSSDYSYYN